MQNLEFEAQKMRGDADWGWPRDVVRLPFKKGEARKCSYLQAF